MPRPHPTRCLGGLLVLLTQGLPAQVGAQDAGGKQDGAAAAASTAPAFDLKAYTQLQSLWTPATERAVSRGLEWLKQEQLPRGCWVADVGHKSGDRYVVFNDASAQRSRGKGHIGITSLAGMAFLAAGELPGRGRYGAEVRKCVDYILSCVNANGYITDSGTRMYSHAFATLFLAEVYGMSRRKEIKKGLEKAVHMIVDCQNAHGAWRYNPFTTRADLSVTVCQLQALRAARNIGIEVPRKTIDRAVAYVKDSRTAYGYAKGLFYYKIHGRGSHRKNQQFSINAAGATALISAGVYDRELLDPVLEFLSQEFKSVSDYYPEHYYFYYGNYYTCQALFHGSPAVKRDLFRPYFLRVRDHLLRSQRQDGRWHNSVGPGEAFATAMACVILQLPKQYLPIFQR